MTATLPPMIRFQPLVAGVPLPGGKVYFYISGTTTPQNVYAEDGTTSLGNNLTLDANGATDFRLGTGLTYKIDLKTAAGASVTGWPVDKVVGSDGVLVSLADASDVALGDALVAVKQPFTGATARTQHTKNIETLSTGDFGPAGDGITDDTTAIQAAITAAGTRRLVWEPGTYLVGNLTIPNGINWLAKPGVTLLAKSSVTAMSWVTASSQQGGTIDGLTFDINHNTNSPHILGLGDNARGWDIKNCTFLHMYERAAIRADFPSHVSGDGNLKFRNCTFSHSTGNGNALKAAGAFAIYAVPGGGVTDLVFQDLEITDCGGPMMAIGCTNNTMVVAGVPTYGTYDRVTVERVTVTGNGGGPDGPIPMELTSIDHLNISGCIIDSATRGIGTLGCRYGQSSGNTISGQTSYAHEIGLLDTFVISGESIHNCATFIKNNNSVAGYPDTRNLLIEGNKINGTGLSSYTANTNGIAFSTPLGDPLANIVIRGNSFINTQYWDAILRLSYAIGVVVESNDYTIQNSLDAWVFSGIDNQTNAVYNDNTITMTTAWTNQPNHVTGDIPFMFNLLAPMTNVLIENNRLLDTVASPANSDNFGCFGFFGGSQALQNVVVKKNTITGFWGELARMGDTTGTAMLLDNDTTKAVFKAGGTLPSYTKLYATYDSAAIPTTGTYRIGDRIVNSAPTVGQPKAWACTVPGTMGTYSEGKTATADGTPNVVLNAVSSVLHIGDYLTINGVKSRVLGLSGTAMTMDANITAGGPGLAIAYANATLTSEGNL